jgi:SAM-dependent methyltransferase
MVDLRPGVRAVEALADVEAGVIKAARTSSDGLLPERNSAIVEWVRSEFDRMAKFRASGGRRSADDLEQALTERRPVLNQYLGKKTGLNVLEIGTASDITVPRVLGPRMKQYVSVDMHEDQPMTNAWHRNLAVAQIPDANLFRVRGGSYELPVPTGSQDAVVAFCVPGFCFGNPYPEIVKAFSVSEAARVLKPDGQLILGNRRFAHDELGNKLLGPLFPRHEMHMPAIPQLEQIRRLKGDKGYEEMIEEGWLRTFVGFKQ